MATAAATKPGPAKTQKSTPVPSALALTVNRAELLRALSHAAAIVEGKTEAEKLREELDHERRRRQSAEQNVEFYSQREKRAAASARAYKGQATKLHNRAKAGVCPCGNPDTELPKDVSPVLSIVEGGKA